MKVENALYTSPQRIASFAATSSSGPDGRSETITGQEAYMRHGAEMSKNFGTRSRLSSILRARFQELVMSPEMQAIGVQPDSPANC